MEEVVITGMGCISPLGPSPEILWESLLQGKSGVEKIRGFDATGYASQIAAEIKDLDSSAYFSARDQSRYSRVIQYAVCAAMQAVQNAGIVPENEDPTRAGVIIGSGIGGMRCFYDNSVALHTRGPSRVSPFFIPMSITNLVSGEVSNRLKWMGPSYCVVSACATSNHAFAAAYDQIRLGRADVIVTGGADEAVCSLAVAGFAAMKALSTRNDDPAGASRPFDKDRDGFVIGEGAGCLVLESLSHAQKRGAKILARLAGVGVSADAYHMTAPRKDGEGVKLAMSNAIREAGISTKDIGYINTHGTSTPLGDVAECGAIESLFAGNLDNLKVNSSKSMFGHTLGAAGALEAIVTIQSLLDQKLHMTKNVENKDENIHLDVCDKGVVNHNFDYAMSNSFGFGGQNSVVIFGKN